MDFSHIGITGLSEADIQKARKAHGTNALTYKKVNHFWEALVGVAKDPMVILLLVAAIIYFLMGEIGNGIFLA
ncbi:MAG: hypothetical protein K2Q22_01515, partial [Cytophagales bacterium]|nr:hypothetical protein [Cytophagales bacterium]